MSIKATSLGNLDCLPPELQNEAASFLHPAEMACVSKRGLALSLERYQQVFLNYYTKFETFQLAAEIFQFNPIEPGRFYCQRLIQKIIYFVRSHLFTQTLPLLSLPIEGPVFDANIKEALASQDRDLIQFFKTFNRIDELSGLEIPELNENESESAQAASIREWMKQNHPHFKKIKELELDDHGIKAIPSEIRYFFNLEDLNMSRQTIVRIGDGIKHLTKLKYMDLSRNEMEFIPPAIFKIRNLENLSLTENKLTKLPNEISQLQKLTFLSIKDNQFERIPPQISLLPNLECQSDFSEPTSFEKVFDQLMDSRKNHTKPATPLLEGSFPVPANPSFISRPSASSSSSSSSSLIEEHLSRLHNPLPKLADYLSSLEEPELDPLWIDLPIPSKTSSASNSSFSSSSLKTSSSSSMAGSKRVPLEDTDVVMEIAPPTIAPRASFRSEEASPHPTPTENRDSPLPLNKKRKR